MFVDETPSIEEALEFAINAIEGGDMKLGNAALEWILGRDPTHNIALLWMACTVSDEHTKRHYYSLISS
jgi:hypothetical protein